MIFHPSILVEINLKAFKVKELHIKGYIIRYSSGVVYFLQVELLLVKVYRLYLNRFRVVINV